MDIDRQEAYRLVLAAGMLHIKWDLACWGNSFPWFNLFEWRLLWQQGVIAADRSRTFHNLAISASRHFEGFSEEQFWIDVEHFHDRHPETNWADYRGIFERCLRGESVEIIRPGG